ncbi:sigma 54-interacting transcriptional regulator [Anaeromyxobacter dehalogenans]|uniref:Sigma54 specific transcriptional regulator with PAS sensor, Fis family n=1 Tax=Anaeromyxobacter dehalogenans (strain 2CP-C) TaxID=290397 RepID=Q2IMT1_ANADE|nr:sigma 54-interacting transcriptional regulator [Anaeromyxobacter dehalogenans]ABC80114.1 sigma54 specific transcriptional regulator with PAS sensor, Fis family [Anaeromyxobacter dehalogenans 2CP-C]
MKLHDIHLLDLFDVGTDQGWLSMHQQRMVLHSAAAVSIMRAQLVRSLGHDAARAIVFRWGFAQGYFDAMMTSDHLASLEPVDRFVFGCTLHTMEGMVRVAPKVIEANGPGKLHMEANWWHCAEADDHARVLPAGLTSSCWATLGYASGFATYVIGALILFKELSCRCSGAPCCSVMGNDMEGWGERAAEIEGRYTLAGETSFTQQWKEIHRECERARAARSAAAAAHPAPTATLTSVSGPDRTTGPLNFVVCSQSMTELLALAERVAPLEINVLIEGESGTGKEFLARYIHEKSLRGDAPMVAINCAALTEGLLESELFGHVRGAFTGAVRDKPGLFEHAGSGTILLDEIGEMPLCLQAKLLRALETREFRRVGGEKVLRLGARVVASTNRDLRRQVQAGAFREDLFYRLGGFVLTIPPLRERREEIPALAHYFLHSTARRWNKGVQTISPGAMRRLMSYPWPGNVRELQHAIERATVVASQSVLTVKDLNPEIAATGAPAECDLDVEANERQLIEEALRRFHGNRKEAAAALRISPVTLWRRVRKYGLSIT